MYLTQENGQAQYWTASVNNAGPLDRWSDHEGHISWVGGTVLLLSLDGAVQLVTPQGEHKKGRKVCLL